MMTTAETVSAIIADQLLADSVEVVLTAEEARLVLALLMPATYVDIDELGDALSRIDVQLVNPAREIVNLTREHANAVSDAGHLILNRGRA